MDPTVELSIYDLRVSWNNPNTYNADQADRMCEDFAASFCNQPKLVRLLQKGISMLIYQEFQNEFSTLLTKFIDALKSTDIGTWNGPIFGTLKERRRSIARLIWIRVIEDCSKLKNSGNVKKLNTTDSGMPRGSIESDDMKILEVFADVPSEDFYEDCFKGLAFEELWTRLAFVLQRSFLQLAVYDNDQSEILNIFKIRGDAMYDSVPLQYLLSTSEPFLAGEQKPCFELDSISQNDTLCESYICGWELPQYLRAAASPLVANILYKDESLHHLENTHQELLPVLEQVSIQVESQISNTVALYGDGESARAATCGDILREICNDRHAHVILRIVALAAVSVIGTFATLSSLSMYFDISTARVPQLIQPSGTNAAGSCGRLLRANEHYIMVLFDHDQFDVQQGSRRALIWLCQTLRVVPQLPSESLYLSPTWKAIEYQQHETDCVSTFILKPLEAVKANPRTGCWHELFQKGIISYRRISRNWGVGLEISFNLMVQLAAVENYFWLGDEGVTEDTDTHSGGYLLYGFYTALIPTIFEPMQYSIQWHFESSKSKIIDPHNLYSARKGVEWYKLRDYHYLAQSTCFVGWCEEANIMLGTKDLPNAVDWSGLPSRT